jgi:hypothetical protein
MRHKLGGAMAAILGLKHIKGRHRNVRLVHESEVPCIRDDAKGRPGHVLAMQSQHRGDVIAPSKESPPS